MPQATWKSTNRRIVACERCTRLRLHCQTIAREKRRQYQDQTYWGRGVPNFGDSQARLLIVGLAPGAHGANRTGRMFTGDRSGDYLFAALHRAGFANQALSTGRRDGLELSDCAITAVCHCAPPDNRPTRDEVEACEPFLDETVGQLPIQVFLALGQIAWRATFRHAKRKDLWHAALPKFGHGAATKLSSGQQVFASYHPSQQNTFTGRLTPAMLDAVLKRIRKILNPSAGQA